MMQEKHKYYEMAYRAHSGTSLSPERRAISECEYYDSVVAEFIAAGKEWAIEKFTRLFLKGLAANARCYSSMIAGPARFPVARMEKYNKWARNADDETLAFIAKVRKPPVQPRTELEYNIEAKEYEVNGVKVLHNTEQNRLQLLFDGKPEAAMIEKLKARGFKWSLRNMAWQRQLTPNAVAVVPYILNQQVA